MLGLQDQRHIMLIDLSQAESSTQALSLVEQNMKDSQRLSASGRLAINAAELVLTQNMLSHVRQLASQHGVFIEAIYSQVPQTQQAALDEGYFVKTTPFNEHSFDENNGHTAGISDSQGHSIGLPMETSTLFLKQTIRSGRVIHYAGNIVVIGDVHVGSELVATGDITIWGELRGIAHAGSKGDFKAEIRAMRIEALQLRIAEYIARRPDRIYYHKPNGDPLTVAPEVARVADGEIKIFKDMMD
jgi:septum site-determining protein MinC